MTETITAGAFGTPERIDLAPYRDAIQRAPELVYSNGFAVELKRPRGVRQHSTRGLTRSLDYSKEGLAMNATRTCSIDGCSSPHKAKGYCHAHYTRLRRHGDPLGGRFPARECSVAGCDALHVCKGYCQSHYNRLKKYGDPLFVPEPPSLENRLLSKAKRDPETGCLRWTGAHNDKGYGSAWDGNRVTAVHRIAYQAWVGPIPDGYEIDHVYEHGCRYRDCIEPGHLQPVTHSENIDRATRARERCPNGHEYTEDNLGNRGRFKACIICRRERQRRARKIKAACPQCGSVMLRKSITEHLRAMHKEAA